MNLGKPNLEVFADTLLELAQQDGDILVVTGDSRGSARLNHFCETLPEQVVEVGIAEQNLVGLSAGLSMAGKKTYAVSPACFLTARSLEQIKNDVAYSDHPVKLIGISAGVSYGALGSTHHSLHDPGQGDGHPAHDGVAGEFSREHLAGVRRKDQVRSVVVPEAV